MPVKYTMVKRSNLNDPEKPDKYYATPTKLKKMTLSEVGAEINKITRISNIDIVKILFAFSEVVPKLLSDGNIVSLGYLGDLRISFSSEGVENPKKLKKNQIKIVGIRYNPGKEMKENIKNIDFELAD